MTFSYCYDKCQFFQDKHPRAADSCAFVCTQSRICACYMYCEVDIIVHYIPENSNRDKQETFRQSLNST